MAGYRSNWLIDSDDPQAPMAVARPASTSQVSEILTACNQTGLGVVPQGGRTGLAGGAVPSTGTTALSLEKMTRVEEIDTAASVLVVEAGVTLKQTQEAASKLGMQFGIHALD